jgi:hypothetical protein
MRSTAPLAILVSIGALVSCSSPSEVLVAQSAEQTSSTANDSLEASANTESVPASSDSVAIEAPSTPTVQSAPSLPVTDPAAEPTPDEFPPTDEDWATHRLAPLAPSPDQLGPGWTFGYGNTIEASPADPADALPGCDAPVPPTFDGLSLSYGFTSVGQPEQELEMELGEGDAAGAQIWVDAFRALAECSFSSDGFSEDFDLIDLGVAGADDSSIIVGTRIEGDAQITQAIGVARVDGLVILAFFAVEAEIGEIEAATTVANVLGDTLARS